MPQPPILLNVTLTCYHLCLIKQQTLFQSKLLEQIANKKLVRKPVVNDLLKLDSAGAKSTKELSGN